MPVTYSGYSSVVSATTAAIVTYSRDALQPLRLFMHRPKVVFRARLNMGSIAYPLDSVVYTSVTLGAAADIKPGMLVCFGTASGTSNLGRQRVRKAATDDAIYIGRSSRGARDGEVSLVNACYVTVYDDYRVWSKIPYISPSGVIYKDSDLVCGDHTQKPPPVANCGPGFAATIAVATGKIIVHFDGTASFATAGAATITDYLWDVGDGTITVGTTTSSAITSTFPAGFRWISLTVTDSNGKSHTARCPVFARDPAPGADLSTSAFQITEHRITPAGQQFSFRIFEELSASPKGALCLLWEGEPTSASDRTQMVFQGWENTEPSSINAQRTATLTATTINCLDVAGKLNQLVGLDQMLENDYFRPDTIPAINWLYTTLPNMNNFIHYLLQWSSTALDLADFTWVAGGEDYVGTGFHAGAQSLYDQVNQKCESLVPNHTFVCNRLGQLAVLPDPMVVDLADRPSTVQATLTPADWSDIRYTATYFPRLHWLRGGAVKTHATELSTFFSIAPGDTPGQGLEEQTNDTQLAKSQADLNAVTGHRYARINAPESAYSVSLTSGDDRGIEPAELTWVKLTISAEVAAQRGLSFTEARGLVKELAVRYNYERTGTTKQIDLQWERETVGYTAATVTIATVDPVDTGGWTPDPVPDAPVAPGYGFTDANDNVAFMDNHMSIYRTSDFQSVAPTWTVDHSISADTSLDNWGSHPIYTYIVDPFSPLYRGLGNTVNAFSVNRTGVWRIEDIFAVDGPTSYAQVYAFAGGTYVQYRFIMASFGRYFSDEATNPWLAVASTYQSFGSQPDYNGVKVIFSKDAGATWSAENYVDDLAINDMNLAGHGVFARAAIWLSPRTPGLAYTTAYFETDSSPGVATGRANAKTYVSHDWGETWAETSSPNLDSLNGLSGSLHVPWPDNGSEQTAYGGRIIRDAVTNLQSYHTIRADVGTCTDISPSAGGATMGPLGHPFQIRTFDGDRNEVVLCGWGDGTSVNAEQSSSNGQAAIFISHDGGDSWTTSFGPVPANSNDVYPTQSAFGATTADVIYAWGNEAFIKFSDDGGATWQDKRGNIATLTSGAEQFVLLVGGDPV